MPGKKQKTEAILEWKDRQFSRFVYPLVARVLKGSRVWKMEIRNGGLRFGDLGFENSST
jgi:hypothetical protein